MKLKVVFLGNHTVGVQVVDVLNRRGCLSGVVAHPEDPEDGLRYLSVYEYAQQLNIPAVRASPKMPILLDFINEIKPDLIWVTDYRYLLPTEIFSKATFGAINLHPSLLPKYRGRASLNWAMIHGEKEVGLTAHFIDEGVDTGDIIKQLPLVVHENDHIGDVLNNLYPVYQKLTEEVIDMFISGSVSRQKQSPDQGSIYPGRKPGEGLIDFTKSTIDVLNFIRALSKPYPGAFLEYCGKKIIIWKVEKTEEKFLSLGIQEKDRQIFLQCKDGALRVTEYELSYS